MYCSVLYRIHVTHGRAYLRKRNVVVVVLLRFLKGIFASLGLQTLDPNRFSGNPLSLAGLLHSVFALFFKSLGAPVPWELTVTACGALLLSDKSKTFLLSLLPISAERCSASDFSRLVFSNAQQGLAKHDVLPPCWHHLSRGRPAVAKSRVLTHYCLPAESTEE